MGTHGYMAPEVLSKSTAYDSSADWFSFGCMLYKLLKGHSPFRQHKTKVGEEYNCWEKYIHHTSHNNTSDHINDISDISIKDINGANILI